MLPGWRWKLLPAGRAKGTRTGPCAEPNQEAGVLGSPMMGGYLGRLMSPRGGRGNERVRPDRTNRKLQRDRLQPGAASSGSCDHLGQSSQDSNCQHGCELARKPGNAPEPEPGSHGPATAGRNSPLVTGPSTNGSRTWLSSRGTSITVPSVAASPGCRRGRSQIALGVRGSSARPIGSPAVSGSSSSACSRVAITPDTRRLVSLLQCPRPEVDRTIS